MVVDNKSYLGKPKRFKRHFVLDGDFTLYQFKSPKDEGDSFPFLSLFPFPHLTFPFLFSFFFLSRTSTTCFSLVKGWGNSGEEGGG